MSYTPARDGTISQPMMLLATKTTAGDTALTTDTSGNLFTSLGSLIYGEDPTLGRMTVLGNFLYKNIAASGATASIKAASGILHSVVINTPGSGSQTVSLYDSLTASGTKIATIQATVAGMCLVYDVQFQTGLSVGVTGPAQTNVDLTLTYL